MLREKVLDRGKSAERELIVEAESDCRVMGVESMGSHSFPCTVG